MSDDVALERGGSAMQATVKISERIGPAAVTASPVVVFREASAFALVLGFLVQLLEIRAHAR